MTVPGDKNSRCRPTEITPKNESTHLQSWMSTLFFVRNCTTLHGITRYCTFTHPHSLTLTRKSESSRLLATISILVKMTTRHLKLEPFVKSFYNLESVTDIAGHSGTSTHRDFLLLPQNKRAVETALKWCKYSGKICKTLRGPYPSSSAYVLHKRTWGYRVVADFHDKFPQRLWADDGDRQAT